MTEFVLRPYQFAAVTAGIHSLVNTQDNGLLVEPTGCGKSLMIVNIGKQLNGNLLVFQPSQEILLQNYEKFVRYGYHPRIYSASTGRKQVGGAITLVTIGSVVRKPALFAHAQYGIIDEAHLVKSDAGMYQSFFEALPHIRLLGMTATPYRRHSDGYGGTMAKFLTRTRPRIFHDVVHVTQVKELVDAGYLCPLDYKEVAAFDGSRVRRNSTGNDYKDEAVQLHFKEMDFEGKLVRVVKRCFEVGRKHVLVFTRFVAEAVALAEKIPGSAVVTGKTPDRERDDIIQGFKAGRIPMVANVGVLTTGFDYPELDAVVLARPTLSLSLYYQMCGRPIRIHETKKDALVVDMVGCVKRFGKVEDLHVEKLQGKWAVTSHGKQLTNVYYEGTKPVTLSREAQPDYDPEPEYNQ